MCVNAQILALDYLRAAAGTGKWIEGLGEEQGAIAVSGQLASITTKEEQQRIQRWIPFSGSYVAGGRKLKILSFDADGKFTGTRDTIKPKLATATEIAKEEFSGALEKATVAGTVTFAGDPATHTAVFFFLSLY